MDEKMLTRAMRKAVELGVFPKLVDEKTYLRNWSAMEEILKVAYPPNLEDVKHSEDATPCLADGCNEIIG